MLHFLVFVLSLLTIAPEASLYVTHNKDIVCVLLLVPLEIQANTHLRNDVDNMTLSKQ